MNNNVPQPQPGCSHRTPPDVSDSRTSRFGDGQSIGRWETESDQSDPDDDLGDHGEGHELPDIDIPDESDDEYDVQVRNCKDRLVRDLSSVMDPSNYNR